MLNAMQVNRIGTFYLKSNLHGWSNESSLLGTKGSYTQLQQCLHILVQPIEDAVEPIVGVDEINIEKGLISWISPIARAMTKKRIGDEIDLETPDGQQTLEILDVVYEEIIY